MIEEIKGEGSNIVDGERAFLLYDTYGFPIELTTVLAEEEGLKVDTAGFETAMEEQRKRAQGSSSFESGKQSIIEMVNVSEGESSIFTGYESIGGEAQIRKYRIFDKADRKDLSWSSSSGEAIELVLDRTPFYATSGGQVCDHGWGKISGRKMEILDVIKRGGEIIHIAESDSDPGELRDLISNEKRIVIQVDDRKRLATAANHTGTHLLHAALREVLGKHVAQAGSLVDPEHLRFDFNHFQAITEDEKRLIEQRVNAWIRDSMKVEIELMDYQEAVDAGAIALFDEKYGSKVRVVRIGDISIELCGGTHIDNTGRIGLLLIVSESSVAAGVRRIEALTGEAALHHIHGVYDRMLEATTLLRSSPTELVPKIRSLMSSLDDMKKEIKRYERSGAGGEIDTLIASAEDVEGTRIASGRLSVKDVGALRQQADIFRGRVSSGVAVFSHPHGGKMHYVVTVTDDLVEKGITADLLVKELGKIAGGGGGGKKHLAQLGTKDLESETKVFGALIDIVRKLLKS
jgi:alanyl-tRNA synthetase